MTRDLDPRLEAAARRQITRLVEAIDTSADMSGPAPARPRPRPFALVVAASLVAVAGVVAAVIGADDGTGERTSTDTASGGQCAAERADDGEVASGSSPDGTPWVVEVRGQPPDVGVWSTVGEDESSQEHAADSWAMLVNEGNLTWSIHGTDRGQVVVAEVPTSTATVEVQLSDGRTLHLCPKTVAPVDALAYAAGFVPAGTTIEDMRALDASRQVLAQLRAAELPRTRGESGGFAVGVLIDPELVELPLGGEPFPGPAAPVP